MENNKNEEIEEFEKIIKSNPEVEDALNKMMIRVLKRTTLDELKRNPENEKAKAFILAIELDELSDDLYNICKGLTNLPEGEFEKHEQNLRLVQQTIKSESKELEKFIEEEN